MKIKNSPQRSTFGRLFKNKRKFKINKFLIGLLLAFLFFIVVIASMSYGAMLYKTTAASQILGLLSNAAKTKFKIIPNYINGILSSPEHIYLDIKHTDYQKIAYYRKISLERGQVLPDVKQEGIPAKLTYNGKTYKVELQMTGQNLDHIARPYKWSFRVKVKGVDTIFGMKEFSLLVPNGRGSPYDNPVNEWVCHEIEKQEGIISLRYDFVDVTINGKYVGVYALEEHFDKRLIEHNNLREGIIFKANLDDLSVYNEKKVLTDPDLKAQIILLKTLWKSFIAGDISASKLFDIDKLAKYYAIADLVNGHHTHYGGNTFLYFNPITRLVEPIGREWQSPYEKNVYVYLENPQYSPLYHQKIFNDLKFIRSYIVELDRLSDPEYLNNFFKKIKPKLKQKINILNKDYAAFEYTNDYLYSNQIYIRSRLYPEDGVLIIVAYYDNFSGPILHLTCKNLYSLPIEILGVDFEEKFFLEPVKETILFNANTKSNGQVSYETVAFKVLPTFNSENAMLNNAKIQYRILGTANTNESIVSWWRLSELEKYIEAPISKNKKYSDFEFIYEDKNTKSICIKPGKWVLNENLIIPEGFKLICNEGTSLELRNSATILSYSPLFFSGSKDSPIIIDSTDSTGQGIAVIKAKQESLLEYVNFNNLSNPMQQKWKLTGAVTFYESPAKIISCQFTNNRSEDGLNMVRSNFFINSCAFSNIFSDAFDSDFSNGTISNSSFSRCGNDAIDISGASVNVENIFIDTTGDKGLSVGENSDMSAENISVKNSKIGAASKDCSKLDVTNIKMSNCAFGFALYQKKSEFGPTSINAKKVIMENVKEAYLIEAHSKLTVDGKEIKATNNNVYQNLQ